jgi:hypothetical protein
MKQLEQEKPNRTFHFYIISILIAFWIGLGIGALIVFLI